MSRYAYNVTVYVEYDDDKLHEELKKNQEADYKERAFYGGNPPKPTLVPDAYELASLFYNDKLKFVETMRGKDGEVQLVFKEVEL